MWTLTGARGSKIPKGRFRMLKGESEEFRASVSSCLHVYSCSGSDLRLLGALLGMGRLFRQPIRLRHGQDVICETSTTYQPKGAHRFWEPVYQRYHQSVVKVNPRMVQAQVDGTDLELHSLPACWFLKHAPVDEAADHTFQRVQRMVFRLKESTAECGKF